MPVQNSTGVVRLELGIPNPVMSLLNGNAIIRMLTLQPFEDFYEISLKQKFYVIAKVMVVGLMTLGVGIAATLVNPLFLWAIPLCALITMGLAFNLMTEPPSQKLSLQQQEHMVSEVQKKQCPLKKAPAATLQEDNSSHEESPSEIDAGS